MNIFEQSYTELTHPFKWIEMKKQFQENLEFKIRDIPMEGISQIIHLFAPNNSKSIAEAYGQFVRILTTRSEFIDASLILDGKTHTSRTICIKFRKPGKHMKCHSHGKWMDVINKIATYIGIAFDIPTNKVEKEIKLSAGQEDRNLYYIQSSDTLVFTALARVGFSFQPVWNKSQYEEAYTVALENVANKHDLRKIKNERIATIQNCEGAFPIKRTGSVKSEQVQRAPISPLKGSSMSTSALTDVFTDIETERSEVIEFTEETHKLLKEHGRGATFQNPMCESNSAFFSLFALLGFAVDSDIKKTKIPLRAKLNLDEKNKIKLEFHTVFAETKTPARRESSC